MVAKKESNGKVPLHRLLPFARELELVAYRLDENKDKYPEGNEFLQINEKEIEAAALRHLLKAACEIPEDSETRLEHLAAIVTNTLILMWHANSKNKVQNLPS